MRIIEMEARISPRALRLGELTMIMPDDKARLVPPAVRNGPYYRKESMVDQTQRHSVLPVEM